MASRIQREATREVKFLKIGTKVYKKCQKKMSLFKFDKSRSKVVTSLVTANHFFPFSKRVYIAKVRIREEGIAITGLLSARRTIVV